MKLLLINSVCGIRSTGRIVIDIAAEYEKNGYDVKIAYGRESVPEQYKKYAVRIGTDTNVKLNALSCRIFDNDGFAAKAQTRKFLKWADEYNPDVLWLHNIHGYYLNTPMLFDWIKSRPNMQVKWTLHDCWSFTGHCSHFSYEKCYKWEECCDDCPLVKEYPSSYVFDNSKKNFLKKKQSFVDVADLTVITPSAWLAGLVKKSFLKNYPVEVIYNKIDESVFKPVISDFRFRFHLENKKIILGVASAWGEKKGLYDFFKLAELFDDTYQVILVGLTDKQIKSLPSKIIGIQRTNSKQELAEIYSVADVFVNLTYDDNYPTVNLEAQACGTPCITYRTGGSPESVNPENVIEVGDVEGMKDRIVEVIENGKNENIIPD